MNEEIIDNQKLINVENDYERIIFEYLANNCNEFDDEHIKQLVNLKVEQYKQSLERITNLQQENERLKEENKSYQEYPFIIIEKNGVICSKNQEIERLNNIINELEKYINDNYFYDDVGMKIFDVSLLEDKIKELKESGNNE